jgi:hypothetical protein
MFNGRAEKRMSHHIRHPVLAAHRLPTTEDFRRYVEKSANLDDPPDFTYT